MSRPCRLWRQFLGNEAAASAVEFALVVGPLLLLLFGTVEFGRFIWLRQALEETATSGARCMAIPQPECMSGGAYDAASTRSFILAQGAALGLAMTADDVTIDRDATCSDLDGFSTVRISYDFESAVPGIIEALAVGTALTAEVCFPNQPG